jgi:asparagine synthase (glutamine-hydrolysing)
MSAITGIFNRNGRSVRFEQIKKMNKTLSHRGPDGNCVWFNDFVALGHQMLHSTPESINEKLPFTEEKSGLTITADARIDNRPILAPLLGIEDKKSVPDSIFILKSYQKWGENCSNKLLGDFAFVIWDEENQKLFCARDHMGIKPFYYYSDEDIFLFSTEIKAIFSNSNVPKKLNKTKAALYLMNFPHQDFTFYDNVFSLRPAHSLTLTSDNTNLKRYWKLDPDLRTNLNSEEEYLTEFRNLFAEAIKCRLRSNHPIGFDLSGGLDSSSIVCMSKNIASTKINTFSMVFDEISDSDESAYIKKVIEKGGIDAFFVNGDEIDPLNNIKSILWHIEQPLYTPNIAIIWKKYEKMQGKNIRVLLSGQGGDQCISLGRNYFKDLFINFEWGKMISELSLNSDVIKGSKSRIFFNKALLPTIFDFVPFYFFKKQLYRRLFSKKNFLNQEFSRKINLEQYEKEFYQNYYTADTGRKTHYFSLTYPVQSLFEWIDLATAAFSIEPRYPYFDKRLIEFCYGLPADLKFKNGWNRYIQRRAMENILPREIQWRNNKTGYDSVHRRNLLLFQKEFLEEVISDKNKLLEEFINLKELQNTYNDFKSGTNVNRSVNLWFTTLFYLWLQEHL